MAPADRRTKRLLPCQRGPEAAGQDVEALIEPRRDLRRREAWHPRRRHLESERHAFQPRAELFDRHPDRSRANAGSASPARERNSSTDSAARETRDRQIRLAATAQPLAARRQDRHVRAPSRGSSRRARRTRRARARTCRARAARARPRAARRPPRAAVRRAGHEDPDGSRRRIADERRVGDRPELDEHTTPSRRRAAAAQAEPRLAAAAGPGQRQKPRLRRAPPRPRRAPAHGRRSSSAPEAVRAARSVSGSRIGGEKLPVERTRLGRRVRLERASER